MSENGGIFYISNRHILSQLKKKKFSTINEYEKIFIQLHSRNEINISIMMIKLQGYEKVLQVPHEVIKIDNYLANTLRFHTSKKYHSCHFD